MTRIWGLNNCDSCRKARKWLDARGSEYAFVDVRQSPPDAASLARWLDAVGSERLVNHRSTTWRGLDAAARDAVMASPATTLGEHPTLIKRPVLETSAGVTVGFDADAWQALLD